MTIHPLPPQAYTKDTLMKAYHWLQSQDEAIKQIATSPDVLVSLFMKAQMQGEDALHRPSIRNFKTDLKSLASMMGEWEQLESPEMAPAPSSVTLKAQANYATYQMKTAASTPSPSQLEAPAPKAPMMNSAPAPRPQQLPEPARAVSSHSLGLDEKSKEILQEVQKLYNLSSESEALRMLITMGYHRAKSLLS